MFVLQAVDHADNFRASAKIQLYLQVHQFNVIYLQRAWETKMKEKGTVLSKLYATYKPLRERELKTEEAGKDRVRICYSMFRKR